MFHERFNSCVRSPFRSSWHVHTMGCVWEYDHFVRIYWHWLPSWSGALSPLCCWAPSTRWSRLCLVTVATLKTGSRPLPQVHLSDDLKDPLHIQTRTPIHKHTLASVCWHWTPHRDKGHLKEEFAAGTSDCFLLLMKPQNVVEEWWGKQNGLQ